MENEILSSILWFVFWVIIFSTFLGIFEIISRLKEILNYVIKNRITLFEMEKKIQNIEKNTDRTWTIIGYTNKHEQKKDTADGDK